MIRTPSISVKALPEIQADDPEVAAATLNEFVLMMRSSPVALVPELANEQHYEVPAEFFSEVLGPHGKYSCCYWDDAGSGLADAERLALEITCERARLVDDIDEVGLEQLARGDIDRHTQRAAARSMPAGELPAGLLENPASQG
mgnify:CR=1 FL=1